VSIAGWVIYFDPRSDTKDLITYLTSAVKVIVKFTPIFTLKVKKIFNGTTQTKKKQVINKKKQKDKQKALYLEVLNNQKVQVVWAIREIFWIEE